MGRLWSWAEKIIEKMLDRGIALIYNYGVQKKYFLCTSGSVVEHRLAKARAAGSNPVSCFIFLLKNVEFARFLGIFYVLGFVDSCRQRVDLGFK